MGQAQNQSFEDKVRDRPDSFDDQDVPEDREMSQEYLDAVIPDHVKARIAQRKAERNGVKRAA